MSLKVAKLNPRAIIPARGSADAAGLDLAYCPSLNLEALEEERVVIRPNGDVLLKPGGRVILGTGIAVSLPAGTYGRVAPRSGLAAKYGVDVLAGVVDRDYRGEIKIILIRSDCEKNDLEIRPGDRVAQLVIEQCFMGQPIEVDDVSAFDETERGASGFGSTG